MAIVRPQMSYTMESMMTRRMSFIKGKVSIRTARCRELKVQTDGVYLALIDQLTSTLFRNPVLNKSFDVLPQMKDDRNASDDHVSQKFGLSDRSIRLYRPKVIMSSIPPSNCRMAMKDWMKNPLVNDLSERIFRWKFVCRWTECIKTCK